MKLAPVDFRHKEPKNGRAVVNVRYIKPKFLRDFAFLKGKWVPTSEVGTHGAFECWFPRFDMGGERVCDTEEGCRSLCGEYEHPVRISEEYPEVAIIPLAVMEEGI